MGSPGAGYVLHDLVSDLVTGTAQRQSAEDILTYLDDTVTGLFRGVAPSPEEADIDGDGQLHPFTDGMVLSLDATSAALDVSDTQQLIDAPGTWEDSHETEVSRTQQAERHRRRLDRVGSAAEPS